MIKVAVIMADGLLENIVTNPGESLLSVMQANGLDIEGACEGSLSCSTCHVILPLVWYKKLQAPTEEEQDILDFAPGLTATSRLACQIVLADEHNGLLVSLPEI